MDIDLEIDDGLDDKFSETVDDFMGHAIAKQKELSIPQVSSSFLYSSACYSARYFSIKSEQEKVDLEEFIKEHVDFFESSLRSGIEHYISDDNDL